MPDQVEIHEKSISSNVEDRRNAAHLLKSHFSNLSKGDQAWQDLHKLTGDESRDVRREAAYALGSAFGHLPEKHKDQAWQDLHKLIGDESRRVRREAAYALGSAFGHLPEKHKDQAWKDLIRLAPNWDYYVRRRVIEALGTAFCHVPEKNQQPHPKVWGMRLAACPVFGIQKSSSLRCPDMSGLCS